jgi:hypothetical protein
MKAPAKIREMLAARLVRASIQEIGSVNLQVLTEMQ